VVRRPPVLAARPVEAAGVRGTHGLRLQPPAGGDGADGGRAGRRRARPADRLGQVDSFVRDFTRTSVLVRSPQVDTLLRTVLDAVPTVEVTQAPDGSATLSGVDAARVGELAADVGLVLHELATRTASLEEAFFEATGATEEYVGQLRSAPETAGGIR
jgi:hypothetical protein